MTPRVMAGSPDPATTPSGPMGPGCRKAASQASGLQLLQSQQEPLLLLQQLSDFVFVMGGPGLLQAVDLALNVGALSIESQAFEGPDTVGRVCRGYRLTADVLDERALSFT